MGSFWDAAIKDALDWSRSERTLKRHLRDIATVDEIAGRHPRVREWVEAQYERVEDLKSRHDLAWSSLRWRDLLDVVEHELPEEHELLVQKVPGYWLCTGRPARRFAPRSR